jgi:hypothetical protein
MFRLGDMHKPAEIRSTRGKEWRFFEWFFQKILLEPCKENSLLMINLNVTRYRDINKRRTKIQNIFIDKSEKKYKC